MLKRALILISFTLLIQLINSCYKPEPCPLFKSTEKRVGLNLEQSSSDSLAFSITFERQDNEPVSFKDVKLSIPQAGTLYATTPCQVFVEFTDTISEVKIFLEDLDNSTTTEITSYFDANGFSSSGSSNTANLSLFSETPSNSNFTRIEVKYLLPLSNLPKNYELEARVIFTSGKIIENRGAPFITT